MVRTEVDGLVASVSVDVHDVDVHDVDVHSVDVHGGNGAELAKEAGIDPALMIDLSASLNPFAPDVAALAAKHLASISTYPNEANASKLLAEEFAVDDDCLVLTNGGAEAIALVAQQLEVGNIVEPEFSLYRRHLHKVDKAAGRWRSNPGNPLGQLAAANDEAEVWDEAFYPLATGCWTRGDTQSWRVGSLTKIWSCPGLRIGYVIAPNADLAQSIRRVRPQWAVNSLALALVPELVELSNLSDWSLQISELRKQFVRRLEAFGFEVTESTVNWVLIHNRPGLDVALAARGVAVRNCASFGLVGTHRVALPKPEDWYRVIKALEACAG